jgi:hypothetical protein
VLGLSLSSGSRHGDSENNLKCQGLGGALMELIRLLFAHA